MRTALTIAGSDPCGGAGIQADLRVFHHLGVYGLSVISAITAQNTQGVASCVPVGADVLEKQLMTLLKDIRPHALKTGLLHSRDAVRAVAGIVRNSRLDNLVVDPVISSSSGSSLAETGAIDILRDELLPLAKVITPNIPEAETLSGITIRDLASLRRAALALGELCEGTVVITGGHYDTSCRQPGKTCEVIFDGRQYELLEGRRRRGEFHGTGCNFSAAVTAYLARGLSPRKAINGARDLMATAIAQARRPGGAMRIPYV